MHGKTRIEALGPERTVDSGDQLGSVVPTGIAVAGSAATVFLNAIL